MDTRSPKRLWKNAARLLRRIGWLLVFVLALTFAFGAWRYSLPAVDAASPANQRAAFVDPAQQAVWDYLLNHSGSNPAPTPVAFADSAQQGVMSYINAHSQVGQDRSISGLWDQATQAILDYLRIHSR